MFFLRIHLKYISSYKYVCIWLKAIAFIWFKSFTNTFEKIKDCLGNCNKNKNLKMFLKEKREIGGMQYKKIIIKKLKLKIENKFSI